MMKTALAFWQRTGVKAYLTGQLPEDAAPPYLTYEIKGEGFGRAVRCVAHGYFLGEEANAERAAFLQRVEEMLPEGGVKMEKEEEMVVIRRATGDFERLEEKQTVPRLCMAHVQVEMVRYGQ